MKFHHIVPALALLAAAACTETRMRLPAAPADQTEATILSGITPNEEGSFVLAGSEGRYARGGTYAWFGDIVELRGSGGFIARGGSIEGELSASCRTSAADAGTGGVVTRIRNLAYRCRYARDRRTIDARLVLDERATLLDERQGYILLDGVRIDFRSEHHMQGSSIPVSTPLGYVLSANGQVVGGIDLNGNAKPVFLPRDPRLRQAAVVAALSLALFIDAEVGVVSDTGG